MTYEEYIRNPAGKGASNTPNRQMYEQYYVSELDKLLLKVNGRVDYNLYVNGSKFYVHFKMPHHTYEKFFYDVVIEFSTSDKALGAVRDLKKYDVKFFSNDPSFTFTWAYAFNMSDLLIPSLRQKCSKLSLKQAPVIRNPAESTGYNKYLYYAYLLMRLYNLFDKAEFDLKRKPYSAMLSAVVNADRKFEERKKADEAYKKLPKAAKDNLQHKETSKVINPNDPHMVKKTPMIGKSKTIIAKKPMDNVIKPIAKTRKSKRR
ncbi:MAG: hypothetical protein J6Y02_10050 [Pseudobutyrivibrio sp.]|nr:hypothetical protein [Pseudobutyrivibrio sp.]